MAARVRLPAVQHLHVTLPQASLRRAGSQGMRRVKHCGQFGLQQDRIRASPIRKVIPPVWKLVGQGHEHVIVCLSHLLPQTEFHKTWKPDGGPHRGWCTKPPQGYSSQRLPGMRCLSDLCSVQPAQLSTAALL